MAVQKEFSKDYIEDGMLYKNVENKFKAMRKKQENGESDESGDESTDDSQIQVVKIWIDIEDTAKMEKTEKIFKAAKKKAETYILYKFREDLAFNKGMKKLVTLPDFEEDEEGYSTEDREKSTDSSEDKDEIEIS